MPAVPLASGAPDRPDVFLSYAREDKAVADRLSAALLERGKDVWIDVEDIRGGASDWRANVRAGIEAAKVVVLVLSPDLLASVVCGEELERAVALNKRIVPVLRRPVDGLAVPPAVEAPNWIYAREEDDFDASVARLVDAIELDEAWVEQHARYTQRTSEWLRNDRDPSYLLRGSDLSTAERWLDDEATHAERATADQVTYITAGRRAAARRQRSLLGGVGLALAVTAGLAVLALVLWRSSVDNERTALARAAAAQSVAALARDPEESLRKALRAVQIRRDEPEAAHAMRRAVTQARWTALLRLDDPGGAAPLLDMDVGADHVATAAGDGSAAIWSTRTRRAVELDGHEDAVNSVMLSPDGRSAVTASDDGTARTWDARGRSVHVLDPKSGAVLLATYGGRGRLVATATYHPDRDDGEAQIWDAASGRRLARMPARGDLARTIRLSPDGRRLLSPRGDDAWLWDVATRRHVATLPGDGFEQLRVALFSDDGRRIATLDTGGEVTLWATAGARELARFKPAHDAVTDLDLSHDGRRVVTAGSNGTAEIRQAGTGHRIAVLRNGTSLTSAQFDGGGRLIVTGGDDGVARVWDVASERPLQVLHGHTAAVRVARFSADATQVLTASDDGSARLWPARPTTPSDPRWQRAESTSFGPDSRHVLVARGTRRGVWDVATGRVVELAGGGVETERVAWPCGRAAGCSPWSPDGRLVAGATKDGGAVAWDARGGAVRRRFGPARGTVAGVAFSRDGRSVVVADGGRPQAALWKLDGARPEAFVPARAADPIQSAQFVAEPLRVLTVDASGLAQLSDPATGTSAELAGMTRPPAAAASDDGARVAVGSSEGELRVSDGGPAARPRPVRATAGEPVSSLAWDRAGALVATGGQQGTTRIWDAEALRATTLRAPGGAVDSVAFSRDGAIVLDTSETVVRLWDRALRRLALELPRSNGVAELSPDSRLLALAGGGPLEVRPCDACATLSELVRRARALLPAP